MNWQPIETAPRDGTEFLAYSTRCGKCDVVVWRDFGSYGYFDPVQSDGECGPFENEFGYGSDDATHWMPLPEPPK